jgi:hypothetical protein
MRKGQSWETVNCPGSDLLVILRTGQLVECVEILPERKRRARSVQDQRVTENFRAGIARMVAARDERRALRLIYEAFWSTRADGTARRGPVPVSRAFFPHADTLARDPLRKKRRANEPGMV